MPGGRIRPVSKVSQPASVERPAGKLKSLCGLGRVSVISSLPVFKTELDRGLVDP